MPSSFPKQKSALAISLGRFGLWVIIRLLVQLVSVETFDWNLECDKLLPALVFIPIHNSKYVLLLTVLVEY